MSWTQPQDYETICAKCGKRRGDHQATSMHCPAGMKGRIGFTAFSATAKFKPVPLRVRAGEEREP